MRLKHDKQSQIRASKNHIDKLKAQKDDLVSKQYSLAEEKRKLELDYERQMQQLRDRKRKLQE